MHEYSLVSALLESVENEARSRDAGAVNRIRVRIGELSGVEPDLFETAFALARIDTRCAEAELEIIQVAARWACSACDQGLAPGSVLRCPACGSPALLAAGGDLVLEQIEMELS